MMQNKKIIILSGILLIGIASAASYWYWHANSPARNENLPASQEDNRVDNKDQPLSDSSSNNSTSNPDKTLTTSQSSTDTQNIEKPVITRAEMSGDYIRVSAILSKASNGTCRLELKKAGQPTYSESAEIIVGPSYYTCNGFRVSRSKLASGGEWTATISHVINGQSVASDAKTVTVP